MNVITYQIELLEPVLVTSLQGDPNSGVAFDYLPGSVLRGAIISRYRQSNPDFDSANATIRRLFFNGCTRYLNAYPAENGQRALPVPRTWQRMKGETTPITDFVVQPGDPDKDWQRVSAPFWLLEADQVRLLQPERRVAVHIARDRHLAYADSERIRREVYRYDALAPGQTFAGLILCAGDDLVDMLLPLLKGRWSIGGSRSGGYGRVSISEARQLAKPADWRETRGERISHEHLTVTFLSDALLRDANGQLAVSSQIVTGTIAQALGAPTLACKQAFLAATPIGGFNRKWGLPLPQAHAVAMGSVFIFDAPGYSRDRLDALEQDGIGERRVEGFGRLALNWLDRETWDVTQEMDSRAVRPVSLKANSPAAKLAGDMAARLLCRDIEAKIAGKADSLGPAIKGVQRSQLSRLRLAIQDALYQEAESGCKQLNSYLDELKARKVTRNQFEKAKVGAIALLDWLERRFDVTKADAIWQELDVRAAGSKIGNITPRLTAEMAYTYNLRLADAVLARAAKEKEGQS